jgi:hypothetical protein
MTITPKGVWSVVGLFAALYVIVVGWPWVEGWLEDRLPAPRSAAPDKSQPIWHARWHQGARHGASPAWRPMTHDRSAHRSA